MISTKRYLATLLVLICTFSVFAQTRNDTVFSPNSDTMYVKHYGRNKVLQWMDTNYKNKCISTKYYFLFDNNICTYSETVFYTKPKSKLKEEYYQTGELKSRISTVHGKIEGHYLTFYKNGQLENDIMHQKDKRNGISISYYENGVLKQTSEYLDGKRNGINTDYWKNGKIKSELIYRDDKPWTVVSAFDSSGNSLDKGSLTDGCGSFLIYNEKGILVKTGNYKNGKIINQ